ncbi:MAG: YebC/PmpR family DNA-binding transcriptional regulator [Rickettsiales bacterium]|jgi:YebC/PmpR family DNA-binding regulatory protein|nr:YebC/PmpR family DNA-binding transcriptional regulator [Rickettsiales bacterium]
MSGHSKWANIQHRKGAQDARRGNLFTKLAKEITVAAKLGDPNPDMNPRLRLAVLAARKESMPNDNIKRAIARALPGSGEGDYSELRYEGYAPGGVSVIVECLTDNKNRTASEARMLFSKHGGSLGEAGSVSYNFEHVGLFAYKNSAAPFESVFETALEAGAKDVEEDDGMYIIACEIPDFGALAKALEKYGEPESAKIAWQPKVAIPLAADEADKLEKFVGALEDNDDVQEVYTNAEY